MENNSINTIILNTDSYKFSHFKQYPPETKHISSYIESRGNAFPFVHPNPEVVHFGLQMFLPKLQERITKEKVDFAESIATAHGLDFNRMGWMDIVHKHNGILPISIQALPEGTVIPIRTPQVQVRNTDPNAYWLTSYIETALLRAVWYPSTVATLSREIKKIINHYLVLTADNNDSLLFKLHDFGCRGASSFESAAIGGAGHLVNFMGTDTVPALIAARQYYGCDMAGFSVAAAEHSTITAWGPDGEEEAYANMFKQFGKPGKIVSVVSDSYDIFNACEKIWGESLKQTVEESGAVLVVRPDSGDPKTVTLKVIEILASKFGYTLNSKGFKMLPPNVRIIQGDGIGLQSIEEILKNYQNNGWSAENIVFGMGGALLQQVNRDSLKYAMKANAIDFGNGWEPINKHPKTDPSKASKSGRIAVMKNENGQFVTVPETESNKERNLLTEVFSNGMLKKTWTFDQVRENAKV